MQCSPQTIALYSVGLLGGSIGLGLKKSGFHGKIIGFSALTTIEKALSLGCIDEGYPYEQLEQNISRCDILFLCSPITIIMETLRKLAVFDLPENLIITDVGSTKITITETARATLPPSVRFIGGHPMAGSEKSGPAASDPYLFQNAIYVLTPRDTTPDEQERQFAEFLTRYLGCRHVFLTPETHDLIAATVSHLPHLLAVSLVNFAQSIEERTPGTIQLAAGGFRDVTRIASAPFKMWHDIFLTNKKVIVPLLNDYISQLEALKHGVENDALEEKFVNAAQTRARIPAQHKGFIAPLHEILVIAKDQPGVIASISSILAERSINIKDIEVIKIREGEGGTIKLAFETPDTAKKAVSILNAGGYSAWERR
jgi:prephenate dehydrogenase